mmetsp:Transcript_5184/g.13079  ORF Transcript_5184/g.13079 Transcript_5184/m.13079 type:complete len:327 (-) Transcript_5184:192-1172(-)
MVRPRKTQALPTWGWPRPRLFSSMITRFSISSTLHLAAAELEGPAAAAAMRCCCAATIAAAACHCALDVSAAAAAERSAGCGEAPGASGGLSWLALPPACPKPLPPPCICCHRVDSGPGDASVREPSPQRGVRPERMAAAARPSGVRGSPSGMGMFMSAGVSSAPRMAASSGLRSRLLLVLSMCAAPDSRLSGKKVLPRPGPSMPMPPPLPMSRDASSPCSRSGCGDLRLPPLLRWMFGPADPGTSTCRRGFLRRPSDSAGCPEVGVSLPEAESSRSCCSLSACLRRCLPGSSVMAMCRLSRRTGESMSVPRLGESVSVPSSSCHG